MLWKNWKLLENLRNGVQWWVQSSYENLYLIKGYGAHRLISEFLEKNWKKGGLEKLLKKLIIN